MSASGGKADIVRKCAFQQNDGMKAQDRVGAVVL